MKKIIILVSIVLGFSVFGFSQSFSVELTITNQPKNHIIFGSVSGDDFTPIDSSYLYPESNKVNFKFPANAHPGIYRVVMGQTPYASVMDGPPQQLNFIFNNENLVFKTDFNEPLEKLQIIQSLENKIWFDFLSKDKIIRQNIKTLQKELDFYWSENENEKAAKVANDYNTLQMERDLLINQIVKQNSGGLASMMIKNQRKPMLDGYLTLDERVQSFKKDFFNALDFSDTRLIQTSVYTDNVFEYLVMYNSLEFTPEQREKEYIKAVDIIVENVNKNQQVYQFIMEYLVNGFEILNLKNVNAYISRKYSFSR